MKRILAITLALLMMSAPAWALTESGGGGPIQAGSAIIGKVGIDQTTNGTTNGVNLTTSPRASYRSVIVAPTQSGVWLGLDLGGICGSATKTVYLTSFSITAQSTAAGLATVSFIRRNTVDTLGTPVAGTASAEDSANLVAATATTMAFAGAPTNVVVGVAASTVDVVQASTGVLTGAAGIIGFTAFIANGTPVSFAQPLVLHGVSDCIYAQYNASSGNATGTLTSGWVANYHFQWVEF